MLPPSVLVIIKPVSFKSHFNAFLIFLALIQITYLIFNFYFIKCFFYLIHLSRLTVSQSFNAKAWLIFMTIKYFGMPKNLYKLSHITIIAIVDLIFFKNLQ